MVRKLDDDFRYSSASSPMPIKSYTTMGQNTAESDAEYFDSLIEKYMQDSVDSTNRSLRHLENSEKIGVATAQELHVQREKLENTEKNLDEIHRTTKMTQRNLNSLKSMFGGFFKNKLTKKPSETSEAVVVPQSKSASRLSETVAGLSSKGGSASFSGPSGGSGQYTLNDSTHAAIQGTRWEAMDNQIDKNLGTMSNNLGNLRRLASDLGKEVDSQNDMLGRIHDKTERNDAIVRGQEKQMQKLIGTEPSSNQTTTESLTPSATTKISLMMKAVSLFK